MSDTKYEYFGLIATSNSSGSTAAMQFISGRERTAKIAEELIESDHTVRIFKTIEVEFNITTVTTIEFD